MCMVTVKEENEKETGIGWPREASCRPREARGCSGRHIEAHEGPFASSLQRQKKERATSFIDPRFQREWWCRRLQEEEKFLQQQLATVQQEVQDTLHDRSYSIASVLIPRLMLCNEGYVMQFRVM